VTKAGKATVAIDSMNVTVAGISDIFLVKPYLNI